MFKVKIDLQLGLVEAEGSEEFITKVYKDFYEQVGHKRFKVESHLPSVISETEPTKATEGRSLPTKRVKTLSKARALTNYSQNFDVVNHPKATELESFYEKREVNTDPQKVTVFVYFLQKIMEFPNITEREIFTCFKILGLDIPKVLKQSIRDAKGKTWIDNQDWSNIRVTNLGEVAVEKQLLLANNIK